MADLSPRGYKTPSTEVEVLDPAFWKTVGLNQDARWLEIKEIAANALTLAQAKSSSGSITTNADGVITAGAIPPVGVVHVTGPALPTGLAEGRIVEWTVTTDDLTEALDILYGVHETSPAPDPGPDATPIRLLTGTITALPGTIKSL